MRKQDLIKELEQRGTAECPNLDTCHKIIAVLDKELYSYVKAKETICQICKEKHEDL